MVDEDGLAWLRNETAETAGAMAMMAAAASNFMVEIESSVR
jgi:hypothetical protein